MSDRNNWFLFPLYQKLFQKNFSDVALRTALQSTAQCETNSLCQVLVNIEHIILSDTH